MTINLRPTQLALLCGLLLAFTLGVSAAEAGASPRTADAPQAVKGLKAAQGARSIVVAWKAPANSRRAKVRGYRVTLANADSATAPVVRSARTRKLSVTFGALSPGRYAVRVTALGSAGRGRSAATRAAVANASATVGALSDSAPSALAEAPLIPAPTGFAAIPGPGTITLVWQAPADGGTPVSAYQIRARAAGSTNWLAPTAVKADALSRELTISGTSAWEFQIRAVGADGAGAWSAIATAAPGPTV